MKKARWLFLGAFLAGCAPMTTVNLYRDDLVFPAQDPAAVKVFQKKPDQREFIEIGEITVDEAEAWSEVERIFKIKAAEFGGDAVYVLKTEYITREIEPHGCYFDYAFVYPHGFWYPYDMPGFCHHYYYCYGFPGGSYTYITSTGIVIKYTDATDNEVY